AGPGTHAAEPEEEPVAMSFEEPVAAAPSPARATPPVPAPAKPEPEFELAQDYELVITPEPLVPAHDQRPPEQPGALSADQFLADMASELDEMGIDQLAPVATKPGAPPPAPPAPPVQPPQPPPAHVAAAPVEHGEPGPLKEVFDEFRAELGE